MMLADFMTGKVLAGAAALSLAACVGSFFYGRSTGIDHCQAKAVKALSKAQRAMDKATRAWAVRDAQIVAADTARDIVFREITREVPSIVERPVYRNVCLDGDGLRLVNRAVEAANGPATGGADGSAAEIR